MCVTCVNVIIAVSIALVSFPYLSVINTRNWFFVLLIGSGPSTPTGTNSEGPTGEAFQRPVMVEFGTHARAQTTTLNGVTDVCDHLRLIAASS